MGQPSIDPSIVSSLLMKYGIMSERSRYLWNLRKKRGRDGASGHGPSDPVRTSRSLSLSTRNFFLNDA